MKRFRELNILITEDKFENFIEALSRDLPQEWTRDEKRESEVPSLSSQKMYCFNRNRNDGLDSKLWITERNSKNLYVSNIVPTELKQLKIDDYNNVLLDFLNYGLEKLVTNLGGTIELISDTYSLEDLVGSDGSQKLRIFSSSANKSSGSTHPSDRRRWFEFITLIHRTKKDISPEEVEKFLVEDGWTEDFAFELACEFEFSLNLLEFYEGE